MVTVNFGDPRLPAHFWSKCLPEPNSGCWLWIASVDRDGYGRFHVENNATAQAHRTSWIAIHGPVPNETLDHLCRVRCCVNPAHLQPVTHAENSRRAARLITACPSGHPYDEANTYVQRTADGRAKRFCRACNRSAALKSAERRRAHS